MCNYYIYRVVQCALLQEPRNMDVAQTTLAEFLALHPQSPALWKQSVCMSYTYS